MSHNRKKAVAIAKTRQIDTMHLLTNALGALSLGILLLALI